MPLLLLLLLLLVCRFVAAFQQAHDNKVQAANLEQADQLAAQIFAAIQQQQG